VSEIVFVLVVLLGIAMLVTGISRKLPIPFTVVLVMIGILLGNLAETWQPLEPLRHFHLSPEIMLFIFLPALLFESGFALDARQMIKELPPILVLAIPAMIMSTFIVGLGVWWLLDVELIVALVFGALISATDPVAVVALFKELGAPNRLNVLVEGESLLNDATAIVVFSILLGIAVEGGGIGWADADDIVVEFLRVFIGGALFGGAMGFAFCELLYRMRSGISVILTTSIVIAYASFVLAEHTLHVSGVMAVVGSAIALRRFGMSRFRQDATHSITETWEVIALSCNSLLFLLVGLSVNTDDLASKIGPVLIAIILVLSARALSVYSLVPLTIKWFSLPHVSKAERHIMWWGGLKGGLAIAVVLSIPSDLPERQFLFDLTIGVVLFTLLISAPTIRPFMERLGMNKISEGEDLELRNSLINARKESRAFLSKLLGSKVVPKPAATGLLNQIRLTFAIGWYDEDGEKHDDDEYLANFRAYQTEREELKTLYETGVLSQYIYLDMSNRLHDMREALRLGKSELGAHIESDHRSLFQRLENSFLRKIRERRWSSRVLSRYQGARMVQQMQRDLAHIMMCHSVVEMLDKQDDLDGETRKRVKSIYTARRKRYRKQLKQTRNQFPDFYRHYIEQLAIRSIINSGWNHVMAEFQHGELGAKGYTAIQNKVDNKLKDISTSAPEVSHDGGTLSELMDDIEIFDDLNDEDRAFIEKSATTITFLAGDTIIGVYEKGDSFYIIVQGQVSVWVKDAFNYTHRMSGFGDGEVIGESSLLAEFEHGRHVRSATIKAETPCTLIRIALRPMLVILKKYPAVKNALQEIHDA
ncbi:cation:proton antiporter, partial [Gammaproteobacteria bacterium]|nr:cation:proton antiporter [Gammaproteobacteria bacterium]